LPQSKGVGGEKKEKMTDGNQKKLARRPGTVSEKVREKEGGKQEEPRGLGAKSE